MPNEDSTKQCLKNEWTVLQKFDSVTLPTLMYVHFNVRLAFVYSSGKCMSHKSRPMLQKNPNMARNSNSRNYYFGKQIIKFSWSWWLSHVTVPNPNQSTQRIVCLDSHVFLGPLKNNFDWKCASANLCQIPPSGSCIIMHQSPVRIKKSYHFAIQYLSKSPSITK